VLSCAKSKLTPETFFAVPETSNAVIVSANERAGDNRMNGNARNERKQFFMYSSTGEGFAAGAKHKLGRLIKI
jgi:hypothetical protein